MKSMIIECQTCGGTGLINGADMREGAFKICPKCKGSGKQEFLYCEFEGRREERGVKRVFGDSCGFVHAGEDVVLEDGTKLNFSKYGCSYEEFCQGVEPWPMEEIYCPYIWKNQGVGNEPLELCKEGMELAKSSSIADCPHFSNKAECWKAYWEKHRAKGEEDE